MHAVARLALHPLITNIQTSWVKMGPEGAALCLNAGANDLGGTLMNESISRAAGTQHGQEFPPEAMEALIRSIGRIPVQRDTLYRPAPEERRAASLQCAGALRPWSMTPPRKCLASGIGSTVSQPVFPVRRSRRRLASIGSRICRNDSEPPAYAASASRALRAANATHEVVGMVDVHADPGSGRRSARSRCARAAARCGRKLSSPKRSGITASGGEQSIAFEPRSSCAGTMVNDGAAGAPRRSRRSRPA